MVRTATDGVRQEVSERSLFSASPAGALSATVKTDASAAALVLRQRTNIEARQSAAARRLLSDPRKSFGKAISTEADRGTPVLFMPILFGGGAAAYFAASGEPAFFSLIAGAIALAVFSVLARSRQRTQLVLLAAMTVVLGVLAAKIETWRSGTKVLGSEISTRLTGRIVQMEHQANGRVRLTIDVLATERPKLRYAPDRVRVSARKVPAGMVSGSVVAGIVRLMPPTGPVRPGSYDFSFESYFDGIGASGFFLSGPDPASTPTGSTFAVRLTSAVENARATLAERIRSRIGGAEGEIAAALIVGVRAGIPEPVNEAMRRTGLAHVLSISGLHMALVAAIIMAALRGGLALFPDFSSRRPVKKYAALVSLSAIAAYLSISGSEVAAERSFIMLAVMLTAVVFDRAALSMRNLAIAAILIIAWSPHEVVGPSFQMSFAATAALIGAYSAWADRKDRHRAFALGPSAFGVARKGLYYLAGLAATSLIAGAATSLYGAYHFQRISVLGLGANLVAMPVVSALVMPFGVMGMIAMPFGLDGPFFEVMGMGITAMIAIADWFSDRSPLDAVGIVPTAAIAIFTVALIAATLFTTWLRLLALPLFALGLLLASGRGTPDALISEDGRLVALRLDDDRVAINRTRPNSFTMENWQRSLQSEAIVQPLDESFSVVEATAADAPFYCADGLCLAINNNGIALAHAESAADARDACGIASIIVINEATARNPCGRKRHVTVITRRDLARHGSAEVFFGDVDNDTIVNFSVLGPYRPWHMQRQFSREARGLPPYVSGQDR